MQQELLGRSDLRATDYAVRDGLIVDVLRRQVARLCGLCAAEFSSYRQTPSPWELHEIAAPFLADALAAIERPANFTLLEYAALTAAQWHTLAAGYLIVL